jgi:hypothetical protein
MNAQLPAPRVYRFSEVDLDALGDLQRTVFGELLAQHGLTADFMDEAYFRWKFDTPCGEGRFAVIEDGDGRYLASSAMFPITVRLGVRRVPAWHNGDSITRTEARGKGAYGACLSALRDDLAPGEVMVAFPNENSLRGFTRFGAIENVDLGQWVAPLPHAALFSPGIREVERFDPSLDAMADRIAAEGPPMIARSARLLDWRYTDHPVTDYDRFEAVEGGQVIGWAVSRRMTFQGAPVTVVCEVWGRDRPVRIRLLRRLARRALRRGAPSLVLPHSDLSWTVAAALGFVPLPGPLQPKRQVMMGVGTDPSSWAVLQVPWRIQGGDWDGF